MKLFPCKGNFSSAAVQPLAKPAASGAESFNLGSTAHANDRQGSSDNESFQICTEGAINATTTIATKKDSWRLLKRIVALPPCGRI